MDSHSVVRENGGDYLYSDKGKYYLDRRDNPKSGIRKPTPNQQEKYSKGHERAFGVPKCRECGVDLLVRTVKVCDECKQKEDQ